MGLDLKFRALLEVLTGATWIPKETQEAIQAINDAPEDEPETKDGE